MDLKEVYTLMGLHFGDGYNMEIFWYKHILIIIRFIFLQVDYDGVSSQFGHSGVALIVQVLNTKLSI